VGKDGRGRRGFVDHALGSMQRPTGGDDRQEIHGLSDPVLGRAQTTQRITRFATLSEAPDLRALIALARPLG
jgi:hypothetical protein